MLANLLVKVFIIGAVLLLPLLAMQFTDDVNWGLFDFAAAGALMFGAALAYELVARKGGTLAYRAATGIAVMTALVLVWINLAVGIIGSEDNPANLMYLGVLAVGAIGAGVARLRPRGMARALFGTAVVQALVPLIAMVVWKSDMTPSVGGIVALNTLFAMLFVGSALLFRHSAAAADVA
jgi:hypothetical protein